MTRVRPQWWHTEHEHSDSTFSYPLNSGIFTYGPFTEGVCTIKGGGTPKHETRNMKPVLTYVNMRPSAPPPLAHSFAAHVNTEICSPFYQVLVRRDDAEQREAFQRILRGLLQVNRLLRV